MTIQEKIIADVIAGAIEPVTVVVTPTSRGVAVTTTGRDTPIATVAISGEFTQGDYDEGFYDLLIADYLRQVNDAIRICLHDGPEHGG